MRRFPLFALTLALVASTLGLASTATAVDSAPAPTATPASPISGQTFTISGNIGTTGSRSVQLQRLNSSWDTYKSGTTAGDGSYSFTASTTEPTRTYRVHAASSGGNPAVDSESLTVTTVTPPPGVITPNGPDTGSLTESPSTHPIGSTVSITANFPNGTFPITLYQEGPADTWTEVATQTSSSSGNTTFTGFPVTAADQRVFARKTNNDRTEVDTISPTRVVTLSVRRDCTGNDCGSTATAYGVVDPVQQGLVFKLQYKSGSSWKTIGPTATTGADGKAQIQFSLSGVPQWTTRTYRLTSAAVGSSPAVTSPQIKFMPGPTQLGVNVLRVDVDGGVYPVTKGPVYTGVATLTVNGGTPALDHVPLESFGVRGTSTANYTKKPYKLKFLNKPGSGKTVFGMPRAKSWTLLANYLDQSFVRDKVGLDLGRRMSNIAWTPDSRYVEMFVNDQYRGAYLMTESVKIDGDRVDVDPENRHDHGGRRLHRRGLAAGLQVVDRQARVRLQGSGRAQDADRWCRGSGGSHHGEAGSRQDAYQGRRDGVVQRSAHRAGGIRPSTSTRLDDRLLLRQGVHEGRRRRLLPKPVLLVGPGRTRQPAGRQVPLRPGLGLRPERRRADRQRFPLRLPEVARRLDTCAEPARRAGARPTPPTGSFSCSRTPSSLPQSRHVGPRCGPSSRRSAPEDVAADKVAVGVGAANDKARWASEPKRFKSRGSFDQEIAYVTKWYQDRYTWMDEQLSN